MQTKSIQSNITKIANNKWFINKIEKVPEAYISNLEMLFLPSIGFLALSIQRYVWYETFIGVCNILFVAVSPIIVSSTIFVHLFYDMGPIWLSMSQNMKLLQRNTIIKVLLSKLWNFEHPKLDLLVVSLNEFLKGIHICFTYFFAAKYIFGFCTNNKLSKYSFILNITHSFHTLESPLNSKYYKGCKIM